MIRPMPPAKHRVDGESKVLLEACSKESLPKELSSHHHPSVWPRRDLGSANVLLWKVSLPYHTYLGTQTLSGSDICGVVWRREVS
jgi:hypothetical protein